MSVNSAFAPISTSYDYEPGANGSVSSSRLYDLPPYNGTSTFGKSRPPVTLAAVGQPPPPYYPAESSVTTHTTGSVASSKRQSWADMMAGSEAAASHSTTNTATSVLPAKIQWAIATLEAAHGIRVTEQFVSSPQDTNAQPSTKQHLTSLPHLAAPNFNPSGQQQQQSASAGNGKYGARRQSWTNVVNASYESSAAPAVYTANGTLRAYDQKGHLRDLALSDSGIVIAADTATLNGSHKSEFVLLPRQLDAHSAQTKQSAGAAGGSSNGGNGKWAWLHSEPLGRRTLLCAGAVLAAIIILTLVGGVFLAHFFNMPKVYRFEWSTPTDLVTSRPDASEAAVVVNLVLQGSASIAAFNAFTDRNWPFAGVSTVVDFNKRHSIAVDNRLTHYCIVTPLLDTEYTFDTLYQAAERTPLDRYRSPAGTWAPTYKWEVHVIPASLSPQYAYDQLPQCATSNATLLLLEPTNTENQCSPEVCSQLCFPAYGIGPQRRVAIVEQHCFWLFVPDWKAGASKDPATNRLLMEAFYAGLGARQQPQQVIAPNANWVNVRTQQG